MARQIKWRLQFKSLNGTGCLVNIYEEGYTGSSADTTKTGADVPFDVESGVTELMGADSPFSYDEDEENTLLQIIRYKTGFLRVREATFGALASLAPSSITAHYVEAFYGSERVFTGYMQCAEYSNNWCAAPRVLEFPITSPLGLLSSFNFNAPSEPSMTTIGALMKEVIDGLSANYTKVIYPGTSYDPWNCLIHSTVVVPFNNDFDFMSTANDLYKPHDYRFFVEGLAACRGCVVHETPDAIIFAKYDQPLTTQGNDFSSMPVANLTNPTSGRTDVNQVATSFSAIFANADNQATVTVVRPLKNLTLNIEGEGALGSKMGVDHCIVHHEAQTMTGAKAVSLESVSTEAAGYQMGIAQFNGSGELQDYGLFAVAYASYDPNTAKSFTFENFWVTKLSSSWPDNLCLMSWKFYGLTQFHAGTTNVLLKMKLSLGTSMKNLKKTGWGRDVQFLLTIKVGDYYVALGNPDYYYEQMIPNPVTFYQATGSIGSNKSLDNYSDIEGIIFTPALRGEGSTEINYNPVIEIGLWKSPATGLANGYYIRYDEVSLQDPNAEWEEYRYKNYPSNYVIKGNDKGIESDEVTVEINDFGYYRNNRSFANANGQIVKMIGTYAYMFQPQKWLRQRCKKVRALASNKNEYVTLYSAFNDGERWRLLAHGFDLWNDNHTVTFVQSKTLE